MTARDFCYWLQGFFELQDAGLASPEGTICLNHPKGLTPFQAETVRKHLGLVFAHDIDPSQGDAAHQAKLNEIHGPAIPNPLAHAQGKFPPGMTPRC